MEILTVVNIKTINVLVMEFVNIKIKVSIKVNLETM